VYDSVTLDDITLDKALISAGGRHGYLVCVIMLVSLHSWS